METVKRLYAGYRTQKFKRGETIYVRDAEPAKAFAVKSGTIRAFAYTAESEEKSVSFIVKNELFPIGWLFSKTETALFYYVAHTDCELYVIDKEAFQHSLANEPSLAHELLTHMVKDYVTKSLQINALEQSRANLKLLYTLHNFALRYGRPIMKDVIRINIPLTQKDLASFAGLTRETVALEVLKLKKSGILTIRRKYYIINIVKLVALIKEDNSSFHADITG